MDISNQPKNTNLDLIAMALREFEPQFGVPTFACGNHWNSFKRYILIVTDTHYISLVAKDAKLAEAVAFTDITKVETVLDTLRISSANKGGITHKLDKADRQQILDALAAHGISPTGVKDLIQETKDLLHESKTELSQLWTETKEELSQVVDQAKAEWSGVKPQSEFLDTPSATSAESSSGISELWLISMNPINQVKVVKLVRELTRKSLADAKKFSENLPAVVMTSTSVMELNKAAEQFQQLGSTCDVRAASAITTVNAGATTSTGSGLPPDARVAIDYGRVVCNEKLGRMRIQVYENGYVSINGGTPERLLSVKGDADVSKKTGPGRFVAGSAAFIATGGLFTNQSNTMRGNVYLYINTDIQSHAISVDLTGTTKYENPVAVMNKIVGACERVLHVNAIQQVPASVQTPSDVDVTAQLEKLASLHQSGVLTDEEFAAAKAKILG